jgi:heme o synthase
VVIGTPAAVRVILANTVALVAASLLPAWFGAGPVYVAGAVIGGAYFLDKSVRLVRHPNTASAMSNFHASLIQLTLLIVVAIVDAVWLR